ncbi:di-trans,poly-cis-decaprenylcistransferase [bacterium]|nr:di-trans,poly-cis-decaprenylcistransferase [Candidatus Omnitrophota bacterium]MBU2528093.1 di-trans,poly-cis-decaprenylcistransferase [bacterium]MBU3929705.1 di-trans,poly-cis-decaprenylcistransferase [bacterium]MBU4123690.1 di-trans,poly-cis-decaprenylcistransferase [bacterium]
MIPRHIAIIMDGNGRWAKEKKLPRVKGHAAGAEAVRRTVEACRAMGVKWLTLYAFSTENWKRSKTEINFLFSLLGKFLAGEEKNMLKNGIRFNAIGDLSELPAALVKKITALKKITGELDGLTLTLALNYGSRDEIIRAVKKLLAARPSGDVEKTFEDALDTKGMPDPDIIIRSSGEMRLSNFLLYQAAYSELYFTGTLWPDFGKDEIQKAVKSYSSRNRRFGGY